MSKLTKLETLQKKVVDTEADFDATYTADLAADNAGRAYAAWVKARLELNNYLKEQDNV